MIKFFLSTTIFLVVISGCQKHNEDTRWTYQVSKVKHSYIAQFSLANVNFRNSAKSLFNGISSFSLVPSDYNFGVVKNAWFNNWCDYQGLLPYILTDGSLSNPISPDHNLMSWVPINIEYIDSTQAIPSGGIIMDTVTYPYVAFNLFNSWNENGDINNRVLGYQVLEFMLFGEDNNVNSGGSRTKYDFLSWSKINDRRRLFTKYVSDHLYYANINSSVSSSFQNEVLAADPDVFIKFLCSGLTTYLDDECVEKGIMIAYNSQDEKYETNRFSDFTLEDLKNRVVLIRDFLDGSVGYPNSESYFLMDFIEEVDPSISSEVRSQLNSLTTKIENVNLPFDQAILSSSERPKILEIGNSFTRISELLKQFSNETWTH